MELNSQKRRLNSEVQSLKSELQMTKIIGASQIKSMNSNVECTVEILNNKIERAIGETMGMSSYASKQIDIMKKENDQLNSYIEKFKQRIGNLEREIGIESSNE